MIASRSHLVNVAVEKKLTDAESSKANQFMLTKGYRATLLYMQIAESTNNKVALRVLNDVVDENNVHVNESLKLLHALEEDEEKALAQNTMEG